MRISKHKNIFGRGYVPNWCEEIVGAFFKKEQQKTKQKTFRIEKVINRRDDKLYIKLLLYVNSFDSWINENSINEWIFYKTKIFRSK